MCIADFKEFIKLTIILIKNEKKKNVLLPSFISTLNYHSNFAIVVLAIINGRTEHRRHKAQ